MGRTDDSEAVRRDITELRSVSRETQSGDSEEPYLPNETEDRSRSMFDWAAVSHALLPVAVRHRAISVSIDTERTSYPVGEPIDFRVTMRNRLPFPISLRTRSPVYWSWAVDGAVEASRVNRAPPDRPGLLQFSRSERKQFRRRWHQRIRKQRADDYVWLPVDPGEYTLSAWVNVGDREEEPLADETTVRIE